MAQESTNIKERQDINLREPRRYKVVIHNDDFTTMDFVVMILKQIFFYSDDKAETLMLQVHNEGKSTVGIYTYDIAHSKVRKATSLAREKNFPLRLTIKEEE